MSFKDSIDAATSTARNLLRIYSQRRYCPQNFRSISGLTSVDLFAQVLTLATIQVLLQALVLGIKFPDINLGQVPGLAILNSSKIVVLFPLYILSFLFVDERLQFKVKLAIYYGSFHLFIYGLIPNLFQIIFLLSENYFLYAVFVCSAFTILAYVSIYNFLRVPTVLWKRLLALFAGIAYLGFVVLLTGLILSSSSLAEMKRYSLFYDPISSELDELVNQKLDFPQLIDVSMNANRITRKVGSGKVAEAKAEIESLRDQIGALDEMYVRLTPFSETLQFRGPKEVWRSYEISVLQLKKIEIELMSLETIESFDIKQVREELASTIKEVQKAKLPEEKNISASPPADSKSARLREQHLINKVDYLVKKTEDIERVLTVVNFVGGALDQSISRIKSVEERVRGQLATLKAFNGMIVF